MKRAVLEYATVVFLLFVVGVALYEWLNTAVSLDQARQEQKIEMADEAMLRQVVLVLSHGTKRSTIVNLVKNGVNQKNHVIKQEGNRVTVDNVVLCFDRTDGLINVGLLSDVEPCSKQ